MTAAGEVNNAKLIADLRGMVGRSHVLTQPWKTRRYRSGFRAGSGEALAIVRPGSLVEMWRVLRRCVQANKIVIAQAANTGLTGGSTPDDSGYDRDVIVINTMRIDRITVIDGGRQVLCLAGATLHALEAALKPYGREPHSVIGSSCLGASVVGGICNNSGGALVRRGPAFTEMGLFARVEAGGEVRLINHLEIGLGDDPEDILDRLDRGAVQPDEVAPETSRHGSDRDYQRHVREVDAALPTRFNADPRRLFEASGCAGRVIVFAVRLDTFPRDGEVRDFYIGTNDPAELSRIRRHILGHFAALPVAGEYIHRDAFDIAAVYGKDTFLAVERLGTSRLPILFALKARLTAVLERLGFPGSRLIELSLQWLGRCWPAHLPRRMMEFRDRFEHHLLLRMADGGIAEAEAYLRRIMPSASGDFFMCNESEGRKAFLHRFAVAAAAVRYKTVKGPAAGDILAFDVALRANDQDWWQHLVEPTDAAACVLHYGHFFCHVFHSDYVVGRGADADLLKQRILARFDACGAEYPAEHNVGHLYPAKAPLAAFYRSLDPCNMLNPGIGHTSKRADWA